MLTSVLFAPTAQPRKFKKGLEDQSVLEEEEAVLEVEVTTKDCVVEWLRNGKPLPKHERFRVEKDGLKRRLIIQKCNLDDTAEFTCKLGDETTTGKLTVNGKSYINS